MGWDDVNSQVLYVGQPYTAPRILSVMLRWKDHFSILYLQQLRALENVHQGGCSSAIKRGTGGEQPKPDRVAATCQKGICFHMGLCGESDVGSFM
jgi:hypothetical protein